MDLGKTFRRSWGIFWNNKALWVFGILAALMGGSNYELNLRFSVSRRFPVGDMGLMLPPQIERYFTSETLIPFILTLIVVGVLVSLVFLVINRLAHGAMIGMADEADWLGSTSLESGWRVGQSKVLNLLLIWIILALPMLVIVVTGIVGILASFLPVIGTVPEPEPFRLDSPLGWAIIGCFAPVFCLGTVLRAILHMLDRFAIRACVLEGRGVIRSIKRGWQVAVSNLGYTVLLWFIFTLLGLFFGVVAAIPAIRLVTPVALSFMSGGSLGVRAVVSLLALFAYSLTVVCVIGGTLTSFNSTVWTLTYRAFTEKSAEAASASATEASV